jgi:hypothetical protein
LKIFLLIGAAVFTWALIKNPKYVAILLFAMIIGDVNIDVPGLPLNLRAIVSLCLLGRIFIEKQKNGPSFFMANYSSIVILFLLFYMITTFANGLLDFSMLKIFITTFIAAYIGYYYFFEENSTKYLKIGLILGGVICLADLIYTSRVIGTIPPVIRIQDVLSGRVNDLDFDNKSNWGFQGFICGTCFVFLFNELMRGRLQNYLEIICIPVMLVGIVMSTSRTGLIVGIIAVLLVLFSTFRESKAGARRVAKFTSLILMVIFLIVFSFQFIISVLGIKNSFMESLTERLVEEPIAVIQKHMGYEYNASALNSMEWREEAADIAYTTYMNLSPAEQFFGIGSGGFYKRDYGHGYNAHNGLLLLLIETGITGFMLYFSMVWLMFRKALKLGIHSSAFFALIFIIGFTLSNNKEMTSDKAFLVIGTLLAELEYFSNQRQGVK